MRVDFAPMQGVTSAVFRRVHHAHFSGVDRYFIPFLAPSVGYCLKDKALREMDVPSLRDFEAVPQILTKSAPDFLRLTQTLAELGFREVNLNLGCPSGTVTAKGKGAGFLADPDALDVFFEQIFRDTPLPVSVKTRLGVTDSAEFDRLLPIYNRYPICELIIHARTRAEFYEGGVHSQAYADALESGMQRVCCNGNLFTREDCQAIQSAYPDLSGMMLGRGLAANPALTEQLHGGGLERERLIQFHDALCSAYHDAYGSYATVLPRMKELWFYLLHSFDCDEKLEKKLRKSLNWDAFFAVTREIFECAPLRQDSKPF